MRMIRDRKQILALASPVRLAIVDVLEGVGPCSVAALARILCTPPDGLYYHLDILERRRLVRRVRSPEGEPKAIIDIAERPMYLGYDAKDNKNRDAITRVVASMLRGALRAFRSTFRPGVRVSGPRRELWAVQRTGRLSADELQTVNVLLNKLIATFDRARRGDTDRPLYTLTFVLSPEEE